MGEIQNRQFRLISRPVGMVKRSDFDFVAVPIGSRALAKLLSKRSTFRLILRCAAG